MSEFKKLLIRLDDLEARLHYLETINPYTIPIQVYQAPTPAPAIGPNTTLAPETTCATQWR